MRKKPIVRIRTKLKGMTNLMATMKFMKFQKAGIKKKKKKRRKVN